MNTIKKTVESLKETVDFLVEKKSEHLKEPNLPEICKFYKDMSAQLEAMAALLKVLAEIKREYSESIIPNLIEALNFDSVKVGGYNYIPTSRIQFSIPEEKKEAGFKWLRENGFDMLIKEGVNSQSLTSAMAEFIEEKGIVPPEEAMSKNTKKYIQVRKA